MNEEDIPGLDEMSTHELRVWIKAQQMRMLEQQRIIKELNALYDISDRDLLKKMFTASEIVFELEGATTGKETTNSYGVADELIVKADDNYRKEMEGGYFGFYTVFSFNAEGKLIQVATWE